MKTVVHTLPPAGFESRWLGTVDLAYAEILAAIGAASTSIAFEFYTFKAGGPGERFRDALVAAAGRGVRVRVLLDAFGSGGLPGDYWAGLARAGSEMAWFNQLSPARFSLRNHRKLVVVDDRVAILGGFNVGPEYEGDGHAHGWRDLGLAIQGPAVAPIAQTFELMWQRRDFGRLRFLRWRGSLARRRTRDSAGTEVMAIGPGLGRNAFDQSLLHRLRTARDVRITAAYFMPRFRLRRALARVVRRGGRVRLILAGKSDVPFVQAAGRIHYQRLLDAGIEIAEYHAQVLHAKLAIVDGAVFAGSSNLDARSLGLNFEIMIRLADPGMVALGRELFDRDWERSRPVDRDEWRRNWTWTRRLYGSAALFFLTKIDPWFSHRQLRHLH